MNLAIISFTKAGSILNKKIANQLEPTHHCSGYYKGRCEENTTLLEVTASLHEWCKEMFGEVDGIIFIGACGIAVRTIAPFLHDKTKDPFVLVIDEKSTFVIPLVSGHIGGGNEMTCLLSELLNATPVITTATDVNHKFAVDVFAQREQLFICNMNMAKEISASILDGKKIGLISRIDWRGSLPYELYMENKDEVNSEIGICISYDEKDKPFFHTLNLIPRWITIGVGCKKNTDSAQFEAFLLNTLKENHISIHAIKNIVSIDLKKEEPCIKIFADRYKIAFLTYSAKELERAEGEFEESEFVKRITGVGNVCERSALIAGNHKLLLRKKAKNGMTIALAMEMRGIQFE